MPPVRTSDGRASKACEACRARKTRCYESGTSSACLRCTTLGLVCSLRDVEATFEARAGGHNCLLVERRIALLETSVERLSSIVEGPQSTPGRTRPESNDQRQHEILSPSQDQPAPLVVIQDAASDAILGDRALHRTISQGHNIIAKGIISKTEAEQLLSFFQRHYGRWIGLDESADPQYFIDGIRTPLLLCACCLITVRYSEVPSVMGTANQLFIEAKSLLGESMLHSQQSIEFFQAALLLSLWSTTLGQRLMSIDSWLISGFALQHRLAADLFKTTSQTLSSEAHHTFPRSVTAVWNHTCLAHLHACVSMRRKSMITEHDIVKARHSLSNDSATNFEQRMVAELHLYWNIYEQCVATDVNLLRARAVLQSWKEEWAFLFDQPRREFLQISFFFAGLLMYEQSLSSRSAAVRESVVSEMMRLSSDILSLSMKKHDDRTKHLTDHVYHIITFAAVTLCRLLCRYESQLTTKFDLSEKDALVSTTISWLRAIDAEPHIGKVMSTLISNVQSKLRPNVQRPLITEAGSQQNGPDLTAIPDFLAMDDYFEFDWDGMIPDWQSVTSDDFMIEPTSV